MVRHGQFCAKQRQAAVEFPFLTVGDDSHNSKPVLVTLDQNDRLHWPNPNLHPAYICDLMWWYWKVASRNKSWPWSIIKIRISDAKPRLLPSAWEKPRLVHEVKHVKRMRESTGVILCTSNVILCIWIINTPVFYKTCSSTNSHDHDDDDDDHEEKFPT